MAKFLLDTSVVIDVLRDKNNRAKFILDLLQQGNTFSYCSMSVAEIYASMRAKEQTSTESLLNSLQCYDITKNIASKAGSLRHEWLQHGVTLSIADTIIASVALTHGLVLITDNIKHYPMPELKKYGSI